MLAKAGQLCDQHKWANVNLVQGDALSYQVPEQVDAVLFSLSYNTMPEPFAVLQRVWRQLCPGGHVVIMDAKPPPGRAGDIVLPLSVWLMKITVLGNPFIQPWRDLADVSDEFEMQEYLLGSYYICRGWKRPAEPKRGRFVGVSRFGRVE
jgi:ubiquinone/menaquinone biosynthesis C-methylase UbiE